jgi:8-oxo-dGTP diphosphatase
VAVVLEGAARGGVPAGERTPQITVLHAVADGDGTIAELAGRDDVVVTADRALRGRVAAAGARVASPGWLLGLLERVGTGPAGPPEPDTGASGRS